MTTGPAFYDDDAVFATYAAHRHRPGNPNDTLEGPAFLAMLGPVEGLRVVDLGCGDGGFGGALLEAGCVAYTGVDGSRKMCAAARETLAGTAGRVVESTVEAWEAPPGSADVVVSRLALHYVADVAPVFARVHRALAAGGRLVFSVEHPVITSCARGWVPGTPRQDWVVDDYHLTGPRATRWLGGEVVKHHRTVEEYFGALRAAGFAVEDLREGRPQLEFLAPEEHARRARIPLFLVLAARKMAAPAEPIVSAPSDDVPLECVAFLVVEGDRVLAERRSPTKRVVPGALAIPGGHMEPGESAEEAVAREIAEELRLTPRSLRYVCTLLHRSEEFRKLHYFAVEAWDGEMIADEAEALRWVPLRDAAALDLDVDRLAVAEYRRLNGP